MTLAVLDLAQNDRDTVWSFYQRTPMRDLDRNAVKRLIDNESTDDDRWTLLALVQRNAGKLPRTGDAIMRMLDEQSGGVR